ncbi:MAG: hypothetical protein ACYC7E_13860 [Armatimonadota bacterium]
MRSLSATIYTIVVAISVLFFAAAPSLAVPAFTRKVGVSCDSCHFGGTNRLTKMGEDFLIRGHRTADDEGAWAKPDDIKWANYLSLSSKVRLFVNTDKDIATAFDVESLSIYTGGALTKNYSYFVEHYLHERGKASGNNGSEVSTATRSKLADAFLQYTTDPSKSTFSYLRAGQIYPFLIYTASSGGRVTISRPRAINNNVAGGNLYTPRDRSYGVSAGYVFGESLKFEAGILNSGGTNARNNLEEVNNFKDLFLTVEKEFDQYGSGIGAYAYSGKFRVLPTTTPIVEENFSRIGVVGQIVRDQFELSGGYFVGEHDDPAIGSAGRRNPKGYYLEAAYNVQPDLTVFARYDNQDNDLIVAASQATRTATGGVVGISKRLDKVGRLVAEYSYTSNRGTDAGSLPTRSLDRGLTVELNWLF